MSHTLNAESITTERHLSHTAQPDVLESAGDALSASGSLAYVFCPRQSSHWSPFGKSVDRSVQSRLYGFQQRLHTGKESLQSYLLPGGGALVECGVREVAGELHHLQPLIYRSSTAIIIFYGFLSNVDELANRLDVEVPSGFSFGRAKSRLYSRGLHGEAAEALLELYLNTHANDLLIMLSELQGQYSFIIYDSGKKQAFAARDPGGHQPLFYNLESDGSVSFTNKPINVPGAESAADWQEVPPGHYVAGKHPSLHQFALTPEQLHARHSSDALEDDLYSGQPIAIPGNCKVKHSHGLYHSSEHHPEADSMFSLSF